MSYDTETKRMYFTCTDCDYTFDTFGFGNPPATYEPCHKCLSVSGSVRRKDVEKARSETITVKPRKMVHPSSMLSYIERLEKVPGNE